MADTILGLSDEQLADYEQRAEQAMLTALESVMARIASHLGATRTAAALVAAGPESVSPDDLAGITPLWTQAVEQDLLPVVAEVYQDSAGTIHTSLITTTGLTDIPPVTSLASEAYLAGAANTFTEVGSDLWETARGQLLDGMAAGESIPELRDRLRASAGMTGRTATLVARTQVLDASNAGSYDTARVSGLDLLKGWEATPDARTRPSHMAAGTFYQGDGMIGLVEPFVVGGFSCERPHDPSLPPAERYNCRCTLVYAMVPTVPRGPEVQLTDLETRHAQRLAQIEAQHLARLAEAQARHAQRLAELDAADATETVVQAAETRHAARLARLAASYEARRAVLVAEHDRRLMQLRGGRPLPSAVAPEPELPAVPGVGPTPVPVRASLMRARTLTGIQALFVRERRAALAGYSGTSRLHTWPGMARFEGDLDTAREHAEGLLRGVERFPLVPIEVRPTTVPGTFYARTTGGRAVEIAERWSGDRSAYLASIQQATMPDAGGIRWHPAGTGSPQAIALHEFGHALTDYLSRRPGGGSLVWSRVREATRIYATERGLPEDKLIEREISLYATKDTDELIGEAFADAMVNGPAASVLSRRIMAVLVDEYDRTTGRGPGAVPIPGRVLPSAPRPTVDVDQSLAEYSARQEGIRRIIQSGMEHRTEGLAGGNVADTFLLTYADGSKLVVKGRVGIDPRRGADAEELGALVAQVVGVRAPAMVRGGNQLTMEFIEGRTGSSLSASQIARLADSREGRQLGLMDAIIGVTDRAQNWIAIGGRERVAAIDFGVAFGRGPEFRFGPENPFTRYLVEPGPGDSLRLRETIDVRADEVGAVRAALQALEPEFARLGRADWHAAMMERVGELERRALAVPAPVEPGLARGVAGALQALTSGKTITEVRALLEALPEAKDALKIARRATTTQGLIRSLNALATRRGLTLPSAKELKAIQAAERAALVAERKAARAAAAEAARLARAEKARQAAIKRQVKAVEQGEFQHLTLVETHAGGASYTDPAGGRWIVETFTSETDARERALYAALQDLVTRDAADPPLRFAVGRGAPELRGWQVAYPDLPVAPVGVGTSDWLAVPLARLQAVTPARIKALVAKAGLSPDVADRLIGERAAGIVRARLLAHRMPSRNAPLLTDVQALARASFAQQAKWVDGPYGTGGLRAKITDFAVDSSPLAPWAEPVMFEGEILLRGRRVGTFSRDYGLDENGEWYAHHAYLELKPDVQGSGFAEAFNANLIDWYRRSGIKQVRLSANIDVGGYAWARAGYEFADQAAADHIAARLTAILGDLTAGVRTSRFMGEKTQTAWMQLDPTEVQAQIRAAQALLVRARQHPKFDDPLHPSAYEFSQVGRHAGQGKDDIWIGKATMLGSYWSAVLYL